MRTRTFSLAAAVAVWATLSACTSANHGGGDPTERAVSALTDGNLPAGTTIAIDIASPESGVVVPGGSVDVSGTAEIGIGLPLPNTAVVYVMDLSGSAVLGGGCGGDQNGDGLSNTILDCEIAAIRALNQQAIADGTIGEVGFVGFAATAAAADVGPAAGVQLVTGPETDDNASGAPDVEEALASATIGGIALFTPRVISPSATSYGAALGAAESILAEMTKTNKVVVLVSDGLNNLGPSVAAALATFPADVTVHTFAIGAAASCTGGLAALGTLKDISDARSGSCTNVPDVASLPAILPEVIHSKLTAVSLTLDGAAVPDPVVVPALPQDGPQAVSWSTTLAGVAPGAHTICATAHGTDAGGAATVSECVEILVNAPPVAVCEDVTVSAGATCAASASIDGGSFDPEGGAVTCVQSPPGPYGIGDTTVTLTCTDPHGATATCSATVTVVDDTPPNVVTTGTPITLWPPNHAYHSFSLEDCVVAVSDNCDGALDVTTAATIVRIESDEAEKAPGSGNTCADAVITSATTSDLRAERVGNGDGRVYTVHFETTDGSGNIGSGTCTVQVPRDRTPANATAIDSGCNYCVGAGCGACPSSGPTCH
jgi:trimeric autotransporter adhesin